MVKVMITEYKVRTQSPLKIFTYSDPEDYRMQFRQRWIRLLISNQLVSFDQEKANSDHLAVQHNFVPTRKKTISNVSNLNLMHLHSILN